MVWGELSLDPAQVLPLEWGKASNLRFWFLCSCGRRISHAFYNVTKGDIRSCGKCPLKARDTQSFISRAVKAHGRKYDYSRSTYVNSRTKLIIVCAEHGEFQQIPITHINGHGCPKCGLASRISRHRGTTEKFIDKAASVWGNKFGYEGTRYAAAAQKVEIRCPVHGPFWQLPYDHISGHGCPSCFPGKHSQAQKEIEAYVRSLGVEVSANDRTVIPPKEIDIFMPTYRLGIEFNGTWYHSASINSASKLRRKHRGKYFLCRDKGIVLLQIDEHEWRDPAKRRVWESIIASKLGKHRKKIWARNTNFRSIPSREANAFLEINHLQGRTPGTKWCFGLFLGAELAGIVIFAGHEKRLLNLTRLAFPLGTTVVGGAQKLFHNSLLFLPKKDIVSFSSNRYSNGAIYPLLGFQKDRDMPPSYEWYFQGKVQNKRRFRHSRLAKALGPGYDPEKTEMENMFAAGARCLYDAGYQRWIYRRKSAF